MKLSLHIIFIIFVILKASSGFSAANPITDIIVDHQERGKDRIYKSIVDQSAEEQNIAKYYKLSDLFASPQANEIVIIRGKLVQNLNNEDSFVFQDGGAVVNITIDPKLWNDAGEKSYALDKNLQFLAKVIINDSNNAVSLQTIKIFHKISDTNNYILTQNDKNVAKQLNSSKNKKLTTRTIADTTPTLESKDINTEEDLDSIGEAESKSTNNLYGIPTTEKEKNVAEQPKIIEEKKDDVKNNSTEPKQVEPANMPEDKPAEEKQAETDTMNTQDQDIQQQEETKEEEPEPEIHNKVPDEVHLQYKRMETDAEAKEERENIKPEDLQKLKQYDDNPPAERKKKSLFSFGK